MHVHESTYRKKSRIQWPQGGDSNSKFFFSAMKERYARNSIDVLYDNSGRKLSTTHEIQGNISAFYRGLIGTDVERLTGINVTVVRNRKKLSPTVEETWVQHVTLEEINAALKSIDINKDLGLDGFNSLFFQKAWRVVKEDVYEAVIEFLPLVSCLNRSTTLLLLLFLKFQMLLVLRTLDQLLVVQ